MDLLMARKTMEDVLVAWRAEGIESVPEALRKPMVYALMDLEELSFATADADYIAPPERVAPILTTLHTLAEQAPALRAKLALVVERLV
jgi:hypothetical protein